MVGTQYEHAGMIKHGAKMIQAVMNVNVPKIALYIGASFGAETTVCADIHTIQTFS